MPADNTKETAKPADKTKNTRKQEAEPQEREIVSSDLDESTHAELRMLYRESVDTVLFAKAQQWKTVGGTLLLFLVFLFIARFVSHDPFLIQGLGAIVLIATPPAMVILMVYQLWQNTERTKLDRIAKQFSSQFRDIRGIKSRMEANIVRYLLLVFMMALVVLASVITFFTLLDLKS